jgi:peptidoglycan/xylan/chitin deacetylase (PgdA/CDA1 family)
MRAPTLETLVLCELGEPSPRRTCPSSLLPNSSGTPVKVEKLGFPAGDSADPAQLRALEPTLGIIIGDVNVPPALQDLPLLGCIKVSGGISPGTNRPAANSGRDLRAGSCVVSTVMRMRRSSSSESDAILLRANAPITASDSFIDVEARAEELGQVLLRRALENIERDQIRSGGRGTESADNTTLISTTAWRLRTPAATLQKLGRAIEPRFLLKSIAATAILVLAAPVRNLFRTLLRRHPVRVFTFHRVSSLCRDGMTVTPDVFRRQLRYLSRTHRVLPLGKCLEIARSGARLARPVAAITFDDGYRSVYTNALPLMRREGVVGACFVSTDFVSTAGRFPHDATLPLADMLEVMDWTELDALRAEGWEIGAHTATHARLSQCDSVTLRQELERPLAALRQRLGIEAPAFAYPFGGREDITASAVEAARHAGYSTCMSDFGGENRLPIDPFQIRRIELGGDHPTLAWKTRVHGLDVGAVRRQHARLTRIAQLWHGAPPVNA